MAVRMALYAVRRSAARLSLSQYRASGLRSSAAHVAIDRFGRGPAEARKTRAAGGFVRVVRAVGRDLPGGPLPWHAGALEDLR